MILCSRNLIVKKEGIQPLLELYAFMHIPVISYYNPDFPSDFLLLLYFLSFCRFLSCFPDFSPLRQLPAALYRQLLYHSLLSVRKRFLPARCFLSSCAAVSGRCCQDLSSPLAAATPIGCSSFTVPLTLPFSAGLPAQPLRSADPSTDPEHRQCSCCND